MTTFKYHAGSMVAEYGDLDEEITSINYTVRLKVKRTLHMTVVRPTMTYRVEACQ